MKRLVSIMLLTLTFGLVYAFSPRFSTPPTTNAAGSAPVTVVNTPLPTTVTNTPSVTISGTPTVNANITTSPTLSVSNTAATPLFVDANGAARSPASGGCTDALSSGGQAFCSLTINTALGTTVPSGKVLVVDTFSMTISVGSGSKVQIATFGGFISIGGNALQGDTIFVPLTLTASNLNSLDEYTFASPVTIYTIAGQGLGCAATTNDSSQVGQMSCLFAGHFVPAS